MSTMNRELGAMLDRMGDCNEAVLAQAMDDQGLAAVIDALATLDPDAFVGLADLINDKATTAKRGKANADFLVAELAMIGWTVAVESLRQRRELEAA